MASVSSPSRAQQFLYLFIALSLFWFYSLWNIASFPAQAQFFVRIFPLWMAVLVGALALGNIGYHLVVFRDCPEAFLELQNQIKAAKQDLAAKGFKAH